MTERLWNGRESWQLPAAVAVLLVVIGLVVVGAPSWGQDQPASSTGARSESAHEPSLVNGRPDCGQCHVCASPSAENLCLRACSRPRTAEIEKRFGGEEPQGVIFLDMLSNVADATDHFGPVPFDHAGHAEWAEIAGGCVLCHHHTPEGAAHPACRTCHEVAFKHEDLRKPGLKGAYHRQCMGCHREWSHETKCKTCHVPRIGEDPTAKRPEMITADDAIGQMHPPIPEPPMEVYETSYPEGIGSKVYFHHERHTKTYHFKCAECHRGDSCVRCHEPGKKHVQHVRTMEEHHRPCATCHQIEGVCDHCHKRAGEAEPAPFTHDQTGWPLSRYHRDNSCRDCHKALKFAKLDRSCTSCHEDWDPDTFDHTVTGQALDENHEEIDCGDCHADRDFSVPPTCEECHEVDEGFVFPQKRPGPVVKP